MRKRPKYVLLLQPQLRNTSQPQRPWQVPAWSPQDALNGPMFVLLEIAALAGGTAYAWACVAPAVIGVACTWFAHPRPAAAAAAIIPPAAVAVAYTVLDRSILVAGIIRLLEAENASWGATACAPMLVLMSLGPPRIPQPVLWALAAAAAGAVFASGTRDAERGESHPLLYTLLASTITMLGTPVFGLRSHAPSSSEAEGPQPTSRGWPVATSAVVGTWYCLAVGLLRGAPTLTSWAGVPMLVSSSLLLAGSFSHCCGMGAQRSEALAWALASVALGVLLALPGWFWARVAASGALGVARAAAWWWW